MNDMMQTGFDYATLPVDAALNARAAAERIKLRLKRTVEDIIEIGRELTAVKNDLPHGQFLPWISTEFEMSEDTAQNFLRVYERFGQKPNNSVFNFKPTILYALAAPSTPDAIIEKALEKAEAGAKVTITDVKDWKAELDAEKQRSEEFRQESNERRKTIRELETQIDLLKAQPAPEPIIQIIEKIPDDYEAIRAKAAQLGTELTQTKAEQTRIIQSAIKAKLSGYQGEVDALERQKAQLEEIIARKNAYLASLDSDVTRIETHRSVIDGSRLELISLAAFLNDLDPMSDQDTLRRWLALADMHEEAAKSIRLVFGPGKPTLTVIHGDAA